jgi:multiple sugar transport system permease protein
MGLWGLGVPIVIYLASLQGVPTDFYEAADLEGANGWTKTWRITLPMISPAILFNVVLGIIGAFQYFTQAYVMTSGGPDNSTLFYALYIYQQGFQFLHMGYASAMAWVLFLIVLLVTLVVFKTSARQVYYGGDD